MAKINLGRVKFAFQGDWNANTNYRKDDVCWFNNSLWICTNPYLSNGFDNMAPVIKTQVITGQEHSQMTRIDVEVTTLWKMTSKEVMKQVIQ